MVSRRSSIRGPARPDPVDISEKTWALVPVPTAAGKAQIDKVANELTDPTRPETIKAYATVILDNLDILIDKLVEAGLIQRDSG